MSDFLPLDLPEPIQADPCWYCGAAVDRWEREHQTPVSRGGATGPVVRSCGPCNHLKGKLTLEEFRSALQRRLGADAVVFAGEARPDLPATTIASVRSLASTPDVVKLDPLTGDRLDRALAWLRARGRGVTRKDAVSAAVEAWLDDLAAAELDGADFPEDAVLPFEGFGPEPIFRPGETSQTPRSVWDREVTKVDSPVLVQARRAVRFLGRIGHSTTLVEFVSAAIAARLDTVEQRYPQFGPVRSAPLGPSSAESGSSEDAEPQSAAR
ncbi:MAG: hypothetical protein WAL41_06355 [Mycobacterium sp.]